MIDYKADISTVRNDLGLDIPYHHGFVRAVSKCWHFSTDGNFKDVIFIDVDDFKAAMNRLAGLLVHHEVLILSFCLMDNHVHFVLYGEYDDCLAFVEEFLRCTSIYLKKRHSLREALKGLPLSKEPVEDENYLKNAIAYDFLNPSVAGLRYTFYDYPWSSGATCMRSQSANSPLWLALPYDSPAFYQAGLSLISDISSTRRRSLCISDDTPASWIVYDGYILPSNYIPTALIDEIYATHRSFSYFSSLSQKKVDEIKSHSAFPETLMQIPDSELRQCKGDLCKELFGNRKSHDLTTQQRLVLARALRKKFLCSVKQLSRIVGLRQADLERML